MNMIYCIGILIYILSKMFLPFVLVAGLIRVFFPKVKALRLLCLLSVLTTLFLDTQLHFFLNPLDMDKIVARVLKDGIIPEFDITGQVILQVMFFFASVLGSILIPLLFARGGVAIVDRLRKFTKSNKDEMKTEVA